MARDLSERERRFVEAFMGASAGNATAAAIAAGYSAKSARRIGTRLSTKDHIRSAIESRVQADPAVADREEIQRFLTGRMRDGEEHPLARLKASDQLNKMQGAYIKRIQFENPPPLRIIHEE